MLHILNCVRDDKFIDELIEVMDASSSSVDHTFVIFSETQEYYYHNIHNTSRINILKDDEFLPLLEDNKYDAVVLHNLSSIPLQLIVEIPKSISLFWFSWGFDIYTMPYYRPFVKINLYHTLTKKYLNGTAINKIKLVHAFINSYLNRKKLQKAVNRVDYYSGVLPVEYDLMKNNKFFKAEKVVFNYFNLNSNIKEENINDPVACGNTFLIGNSCYPTNNHLDILECLYKNNLTNYKIYSFLSYGGMKEYTDKVKEIGRKYFGNNFIPIEDFLPYDKFKEVIMSCGNVIMGHERQQAMGNVYLSLWNGCKVFFSETSVTYNYLKNLGYKIFAIQHDLTDSIINTNMSKEDILINRRLEIKYLSPEICMKRILDIYNILEQKKINVLVDLNLINKIKI
jgi:dTDP-N-acetylfucosamine:lipid II N-acetylfucosaminyltransferase